MIPKFYILFAGLVAYTTAIPTGTGAPIRPHITGEPLPPVEDEIEVIPIPEEPEPFPPVEDEIEIIPIWEDPEPQPPVWEESELQAPTWEASESNPAIPAVWPPPSIPPVWPPPLPGVAGRKARDNAKHTLLPEVVDALTEIFAGKEAKVSSINTKFTENDIINRAGCQPLTLVFARGTNGAGNMGEVVGPALADSLRSILDGQVAVQGVKYPAVFEGNLRLGADGGPEMARLLELALNQCPKTKVALVGYSQGAMVAHYAAAMLRESNPAVAIVTFGDPLGAFPFHNFDPNDVKRFCAEGDPICLNGLDFRAHSSYGQYAGEAAQFIIRAAGPESVADEDVEELASGAD